MTEKVSVRRKEVPEGRKCQKEGSARRKEMSEGRKCQIGEGGRRNIGDA